jgi:bis(5'-nucleosidyl)-tetraphosphatase
MGIDWISCGAVVFNKHKDKFLYLIIQSINGKHWDFAKGQVEGNENEEQTALREIKEETGVVPQIIPHFRGEITYEYKLGHLKKVIFFVAESQSLDTNLQEEEIMDSVWLNYKDAREMLTFDNVKTVLDKAHEFLTNL